MTQNITITGATGWLGLALQDILHNTCGSSIFEHVQLYGSHSRIILGPDGHERVIRPLSDLAHADLRGHLVFHFAALTRDRLSAVSADDFRAASRAIDDTVLKAMERTPPHAVFVASSGAAALHDEPYANAKREQERRFLRTGVPTLAGRLYNLAGPYINKLNGYALSSCIVQARDAGRIVLNADHPVYRSYAHVGDVLSLMLAALQTGAGRDVPFDLAGDQVVELRDVATAVAQHLPATISRPACDEAWVNQYVGDPQALQDWAAQFGHALRPFAVQVADTVRFLVPGFRTC